MCPMRLVKMHVFTDIKNIKNNCLIWINRDARIYRYLKKSNCLIIIIIICTKT